MASPSARIAGMSFFLFFGLLFTTHSTLYPVPFAVGLALLQSSLYDVPGGFKAVMFDRFSGVKNQVCFLAPISVERVGGLKIGA
jgi:hypothetical protein